MFRLWAKTIHSGHIIEEMTIEDASSDRRTAKIVHALSGACRTFDLAEPIWLDRNIRDIKSHRRTRFTQDNFIEQLEIDYLEIQIIEED